MTKRVMVLKTTPGSKLPDLFHRWPIAQPAKGDVYGNGSMTGRADAGRGYKDAAARTALFPTKATGSHGLASTS